jgi:hypothetical protein
LPVIAGWAGLSEAALMLPSLRTILAAMFVTAIVVTMVGTAVTPIYPRVEKPLARRAQAETPMEQPGMYGYLHRAEEPKRPRTIESASEDGGKSHHTKTLVTASVDAAQNDTAGAASAPVSGQPATDSTTQGVDVAITGSANAHSRSEESGPIAGPAASFAAAAKRVEDRCLSCHRGWHLHGIRQRSGVRHRIQVIQDRFTAL